MKEEEIYKDIIGYVGIYQISNYGNVKLLSHTSVGGRFFKTRILPFNLMTAGYYAVGLKAKKHSVHRLVAIHFIPNPLNKKEVNHIDGNKLNNRVDNLEWVTPSENILHAMRCGLIKNTGEKNNQSKLKESDVIEIKKLILIGKKDTEIAKKFNCGRENINRIRHKKTWNHIT